MPFVVFCILEILENLPKKKRYMQSLMPLFALIYGIAGMILLEKINGFLLDALRWLIENLEFLSFLQEVNLDGILTVISNVLLVAGFLVLKPILFAVLAIVNAVPFIPKYLGGIAYKQNSDDRVYYLKKKVGGMRKYFLGMYITAIVATSVLMIAANFITSDFFFNSVFYPAFGVLLLAEIYSFLNGKVAGEKKKKEIVIEEEKPQEEQDYDLLVERYKEIIPDRLLEAIYTAPGKPDDNTVTELLRNYYEEFVSTGNQEANLMFRYFGTAFLKDKELDDGMLRHTRALLDGKSVIFHTLFYKDTTPYIFLPLQRHLMRSGKVLVILGRDSIGESVVSWLETGFEESSNIRGIWKVDHLSQAEESTAVMILHTKDIYNKDLLAEKSALLKKVSFVFLIEPGRLLGTMQMGLSSIVSMFDSDHHPQYVAFDRNCDGLVDSLSHVLNTSIEFVNATTASTARQNTMFWEADGENLQHRLGLENARYLGMGTELAALAVSEGVSKAMWVSAEKFPLVDMKWIVGQYYTTLCTAMKIENSQNELLKHIEFVPDFWSVDKSEDAMIIVEDEYNNAFETARQFAGRGTSQNFVHVISPDYMLREYMTDNHGIFTYDSKAVPNFVADYQRSRANTVYKIIMHLISGKLSEDQLKDMLDTMGISGDNVYKDMCELIKTYFFRVGSGAPEQSAPDALERILFPETINEFDASSGRIKRRRVYSIQDSSFIEKFFAQLTVTHYIAEDETDKSNYVGSMLYGLVFQKYLPGMFTTLAGKYYEIVSVTSQNGVLVRRAADHINGRKYYRVLRSYDVNVHSESNEIGVIRTVGDITIEHLEADITVQTDGYLELSDYADIEHAKKVLINNVARRVYANKELLRIKLEGSDPSVRFTIAALLNELFITVFPDTHEYICATTHVSAPDSTTEAMIPGLSGEEDEYIYIIEDSLIDLGLLINVDRYFIRFFEIICDVLMWHKEKLEQPEKPEEEVETEIPEEEDDDDERMKKKKKKSIFGRIKDFFKGKKKNKDKGSTEGNEPEGEGPAGEVPNGEGPEGEGPAGEVPNGEGPEGDAPKGEKPVKDNPEGKEFEESTNDPTISSFNVAPFVGTTLANETPDDEVGGEDSEDERFTGNGTIPARKPYAERHYFLFGGTEVPACIDIDGVLEYFRKENLDNNYMRQARENAQWSKLRFYNYHFEPGVHYCDFCGKEMKTFDVLDDGRERCEECTKTAVKTLGAFKKLYKETKKELKSIFDVEIKTKIEVRMTNANEIAKEIGKPFIATKGMDPRVLGFARREGNKRYLYLENGAPQLEMRKTLIHELTHMWQYENLPDLFIGDYPKEPVEGMAVWAEVQYLYCIGEEERAEDYMICRIKGGTEYGIGLERYLKKFPIQKSVKSAKKSRTPFGCKKNPLV